MYKNKNTDVVLAVVLLVLLFLFVWYVLKSSISPASSVPAVVAPAPVSVPASTTDWANPTDAKG